jgi:hypothetical protein
VRGAQDGQGEAGTVTRTAIRRLEATQSARALINSPLFSDCKTRASR